MVTAVMTQKTESLRRCLARIEQHRPTSVAQLQDDPDRQDIIALNLTRAIQLSADMASHYLAAHPELPSPQSMGESFSLLGDAGVIDQALAARLRKAVGFRNILVHDYQRINWQVVFSLCYDQLEDFRDFARQLWQVIDAD